MAVNKYFYIFHDWSITLLYNNTCTLSNSYKVCFFVSLSLIASLRAISIFITEFLLVDRTSMLISPNFAPFQCELKNCLSPRKPPTILSHTSVYALVHSSRCSLRANLILCSYMVCALVNSADYILCA